MNEHFHIYAHTRTQQGFTPIVCVCVCGFYTGIRNRRSPFHRAHTQPDRDACVYTWETLRQ